MSPYGVRHLIVGWPCFRRQLVTWVGLRRGAYDDITVCAQRTVMRKHRVCLPGTVFRSE
jgi:hypothetical protein